MSTTADRLGRSGVRVLATALLVSGAAAAGWGGIGNGAVARGAIATGVTEPAAAGSASAPTTSKPATPAPATAPGRAPAAPSPSPTSGSSSARGTDDDAGGSVPAPRATAASVPDGLRPTRITMPSIGVDSSIIDLGIAADGSIEVPQDSRYAGWLATSPAPGQQGPAVIAGHVDSKSGPAVFYTLRKLKVGDPIVVTRRDGTQLTFTVDGLQDFAKSSFPTQATYGPVPGPAIRLITCGGRYDRSAGGYQENLVVFAS